MSQQPPRKPVRTQSQKKEEVASAPATSTVLSIETDAPEPGRIFQAMQELARLLTQAPAGELEIIDEDMSMAYHLHVRVGGKVLEYRNAIMLPALLSPDNAVDALDMIESQMDMAIRPAKNFAMRVLNESKEREGGAPLRLR